jgi:putative tricarboxylic transport membrane protein
MNEPRIFWTFIAAMYLGNAILLLLNLPLVGLFARIAMMRPAVLLPVVSIVCLVGTYSVRNSIFDVWVMIAFGVVGLLFRRWAFPVAPLIIGMVLGPMAEVNLRKTLVMFDGSVLPVLGRPLAAFFVASAVAAIAVMTWRALKRREVVIA